MTDERLVKCQNCGGVGHTTNGHTGQCPRCRGYGTVFRLARYIFINRAAIQRDKGEAPIQVHDGERVIARGYGARILEGCEVVYAERPLRPGGSKLWIETMGPIELLTADGTEIVEGVEDHAGRSYRGEGPCPQCGKDHVWFQPGTSSWWC